MLDLILAKALKIRIHVKDEEQAICTFHDKESISEIQIIENNKKLLATDVMLKNTWTV